MMAAQDKNKQESGFPWQRLLSEGLGMTPHRGSQLGGSLWPMEIQPPPLPINTQRLCRALRDVILGWAQDGKERVP